MPTGTPKILHLVSINPNIKLTCSMHPTPVDTQYRTYVHLLRQQSAVGKSRDNGCCGSSSHNLPQDRSLVHEQPNQVNGPLQG